MHTNWLFAPIRYHSFIATTYSLVWCFFCGTRKKQLHYFTCFLYAVVGWLHISTQQNTTTVNFGCETNWRVMALENTVQQLVVGGKMAHVWIISIYRVYYYTQPFAQTLAEHIWNGKVYRIQQFILLIIFVPKHILHWTVPTNINMCESFRLIEHQTTPDRYQLCDLQEILSTLRKLRYWDWEQQKQQYTSQLLIFILRIVMSVQLLNVQSIPSESLYEKR